jgi:hypothetical protein
VSGNNIESRLKELFYQLCQPELSKIRQYKDMHKGESCYLIGDGISLKWFDLKEFSNKISFSLSTIPFHNDFRLLEAKYLLLTEPFWFYPAFWTNNITNSVSMPYIQKVFRQVIKENPDKQFFLNLSNYPVLRSENLIYLFHDIPDVRLPADFITRRTNIFQGSFRTSIFLAIYMGFDHCYLVGCDYTHVPSRSLHWYEKGQGVFYPLVNFNKDFFEIAKEFIDITTITLDGASDFINAVTYKEYTGRDPEFKENTELVDERYLKVLATWPGYLIY